MHTDIFPPIPPDTVRVASTIFDRSNFYMMVGDQVNDIFNGFTTYLSPSYTKLSIHSYAMLYLITIFQILETLPDKYAALAFESRVDWKYALHLPLNYPSHDGYAFCEFRKWLLADRTRKQKLERLMIKINEIVDLSNSTFFGHNRNRQELEHVCLVSRVLDVYESISQVLETLATLKPELLRPISLPHWYKRYSHHKKVFIPGMEREQLEALGNSISADISHLLKSISTSELRSLADQPEISSLRQVLATHYIFEQGKWIWRERACAHCSLASSPNKF